MLRKAYSPASMFLEAFALLIIGILFFTNPEGTLEFAVSAIHILAWIAVINNLFKWLTKRDGHRPSLFHALLMFGLAVFLSAHPAFIASSASLVFAVWIVQRPCKVYLRIPIVENEKPGMDSDTSAGDPVFTVRLVHFL